MNIERGLTVIEKIKRVQFLPHRATCAAAECNTVFDFLNTDLTATNDKMLLQQ